MEDLYEILEVSRDASQADIKKAYRKLVHQYHPDSHPGDKDIEEKFKKINAAYSVLNDPEKRARYDQFGTTDPNSNPFGGMNFGDIFGDLGDLFSTFGGGFSTGSRRQYNPNSPRRGDDIEKVVNISLLEAYTGTTRDIDITRLETCQHCNGTGAKPGTKPETCPRCHGSGQVRQTQQSFFGQVVSITTCPDCHGAGTIIKEKCDECKGSGRIRKKHTLKGIKIPAGVERNRQFRLQGEGEAGINGGPAGDLFLIIDVEIHPDFERNGADLHTSLLLTYPQAVLGAETEIKMLDGKLEKISVPSGTSQGQILKLKGKGMPKLNSKSFGDLYAHVFIEIPTKLTEKQRELIQSLAEEMKTPISENKSGFAEKLKNLFK